MTATDRQRTGMGGLAAAIALLAMAAPGQASADEALDRLRRGNERFAAGTTAEHPRDEAFRRTLARAQRPFALVLACSDSRVPPEQIFDAGLGELYVVRVLGNVCSDEALAGAELAVERLGVELCVVLAHEDCTAVRHCAGRLEPKGDQGPADPAYQRLLDRVEPAVRAAAGAGWVGEERLARAEEENAQQTVSEMLRRSPVLRQRLRADRLRVLAARYHQESGLVEWLPERDPPRTIGDETAEESEPLVTGPPPHLALSMLRAGHRRFLTATAPRGDRSPERRQSLVHGRQALAVVVTCSDSRLPPEWLFDVGLGELCVVRLPALAFGQEALASIESAVRHRGASLCVVLGHRNCDALAMAAEAGSDPHATASQRLLAERLAPVLEHLPLGDGAHGLDGAAAAQAVRIAEQLASQSALLGRLQVEGRFATAAGLYDLATGEIRWLPVGAPSPAPAFEPAPPPLPAGHGHGSEHELQEHGTGHQPAGHLAEDHDLAPQGPAPHAEPDHGDPAGGDAAPAHAGVPESETSHRLRNHDLAMLITLLGMLAVLGTGLLIWQRQEG